MTFPWNRAESQLNREIAHHLQQLTDEYLRQGYTREEAARQTPENSPVVRRTPASREPPALVVMRDAFPAVLVVSLVAATLLYAFLVLALRGAWGQKSQNFAKNA